MNELDFWLDFCDLFLPPDRLEGNVLREEFDVAYEEASRGLAVLSLAMLSGELDEPGLGHLLRPRRELLASTLRWSGGYAERLLVESIASRALGSRTSAKADSFTEVDMTTEELHRVVALLGQSHTALGRPLCDLLRPRRRGEDLQRYRALRLAGASDGFRWMKRIADLLVRLDGRTRLLAWSVFGGLLVGRNGVYRQAALLLGVFAGQDPSLAEELEGLAHLTDQKWLEGLAEVGWEVGGNRTDDEGGRLAVAHATRIATIVRTRFREDAQLEG